MALPWLFVLELGLYAGCFICGITTAASVTIAQVKGRKHTSLHSSRCYLLHSAAILHSRSFLFDVHTTAKTFVNLKDRVFQTKFYIHSGLAW
uniref:Uncharacterized protein n=1 Tax=Anguilla anguilla TaxID=7936 RepID=A0A0E9W6C8_ANGAN